MTGQADTATNDKVAPEVKECTECGKQFKIVSLEKELYHKLELPDPVRCPTCRQKIRNMWRNRRELVKDTCASCGKEIITTPKFSEGVKIYCKSCYNEYSETNDNIIK